MFLTLLAVTLALSAGVSLVVARAFNGPISQILDRIINDEISAAWVRYLRFATIVVGISSGVRIYDLERYITPNLREVEGLAIDLNLERWVLEVYRTIVETLQGIAWMLLVFFVVALIAYVIVRRHEARN